MEVILLTSRWVLHMDMDAFFAAAEQLTRPTLRGRPVLVGGVGGRGTVAGASYEARRYGPRSAMPMAQARRMCPHAVVLPPRFSVYRSISARVMDLLRARIPVVQQISIDEAFAEPQTLAGATAGQVTAFAEQLRRDIRNSVGLAASVGIGSGKQLAKIGSGMAKPDGCHLVAHGEERAFLDPLPVRKLWGVGPVTEARLHKIGVETIGQLAALHLTDVTSLLGTALGEELHRLAAGIDEHPVAERAEAKQISVETTLEADLVGMDAIQEHAAWMARQAHARLVAARRAARTVTVKLKSADFSIASRSATLSSATTDDTLLAQLAHRLAAEAAPPAAVRLVGVSLSGLADSEQAALFGGLDAAAVSARQVSPAGDVPEDAGDPVLPGHHWQAGQDVTHPDYGHGWVQGAGHGRLTVRFETASTGPGMARTFVGTDPSLRHADPLASLG